MNTPTEGDDVKPKSSFATRVSSVFALASVVGAIAYVGSTVYRVATDGFVAPIILSPDSDMVIQSKLSLSQLLAERMRISARRDALEAVLQGAEQSLEQLKNLHAASSKALEWTSSISATQAAAGAEDQRALRNQREVLTTMIADEEAFADRMKKDLDAGLVSKAEYARERQTLSQMRVAALENDRAHISSDVQMSQVRLTQQAIRSDRTTLSTPEMIMQRNQMVQLQCEMIRMEAEQRSNFAERRSLDEELAKLDELLGQLKARPIFRAIEADTNVAFVPYSQIDGVRTGTVIYDCIWGVFACKSVGRIAELLPGEAILQDPWGSPARGQYAIMNLDDLQAAQSKTLRVRPSSLPVSTPAATPSRIAKK